MSKTYPELSKSGFPISTCMTRVSADSGTRSKNDCKLVLRFHITCVVVLSVFSKSSSKYHQIVIIIFNDALCYQLCAGRVALLHVVQWWTTDVHIVRLENDFETRNWAMSVSRFELDIFKFKIISLHFLLID